MRTPNSESLRERGVFASRESSRSAGHSPRRINSERALGRLSQAAVGDTGYSCG